MEGRNIYCFLLILSSIFIILMRFRKKYLFFILHSSLFNFPVFSFNLVFFSTLPPASSLQHLLFFLHLEQTVKEIVYFQFCICFCLKPNPVYIQMYFICLLDVYISILLIYLFTLRNIYAPIHLNLNFYI